MNQTMICWEASQEKRHQGNAVLGFSRLQFNVSLRLTSESSVECCVIDERFGKYCNCHLQGDGNCNVMHHGNAMKLYDINAFYVTVADENALSSCHLEHYT